ncbi:MAG: DUF4397 domain-containing protein [bacterium]
MKSFRPIAALLGVVLLASCDKNAAQTISAPIAGSAVKFFNFGVGSPSVNFYANDQKLSAVSSTSCSSAVNGATTDTTCLTGGKESKSGTAYGSAAIGGGLYASAAPGAYTLSARITTAVDSGVAIASTPATLADGKFYSYYLSGPYSSSAKSVAAFMVEDPIPTVDYRGAYVRFVNASSNSQPMVLTATDPTSGLEAVVSTVVSYKSASAFVLIPPGIFDLKTYVAGSATSVISRTGVSFSAGRVYTVSAYGDITATTGAAKPALDNTANR